MKLEYKRFKRLTPALRRLEKVETSSGRKEIGERRTMSLEVIGLSDEKFAGGGGGGVHMSSARNGSHMNICLIEPGA